MLRRAAARAATGRPRQSPIVGFSWDHRRACVIGSEPASREVIASALGHLGSMEVVSLDLTSRSIGALAQRDYGLVIADVRAGDPVALLGGLARRLAGPARRGVPVAVVHAPDDGASPAIESLVREVGGHRLMRPIDPKTLLFLLDGPRAVGPGGVLGQAASS